MICVVEELLNRHSDMLKCACNCLQICWNYLLKHHWIETIWKNEVRVRVEIDRMCCNYQAHIHCGDSFLCMFDTLITAYQNSVVCSLHMFAHVCTILLTCAELVSRCFKGFKPGFLQQLPLAHLLIFRSSSWGRPHSTEVNRPKIAAGHGFIQAETPMKKVLVGIAVATGDRTHEHLTS